MKTNEFLTKNGLHKISFEDSKGNRESMESIMNRFIAPMEKKKAELKEMIAANKKRLDNETMSMMTEMSLKIETEKLQFALQTLQTL